MQLHPQLGVFLWVDTGSWIRIHQRCCKKVIEQSVVVMFIQFYCAAPNSFRGTIFVTQREDTIQVGDKRSPLLVQFSDM